MKRSRDPLPVTTEEEKKEEETREEAPTEATETTGEPDLPQLKPVSRVNTGNRITFTKDTNEPPYSPRALYVPSPRGRDNGRSSASRPTCSACLI